MSDTALMALGVLELTGLVGLFVLVRRAAERRDAGKGRARRLVRISTALLGLLVVVGFPVLMILSIINPTIWTERQHQKLVQTGTPATAIINHIEETGTVINSRPEVRVLMTVQPQAAPAFNSQSTWVFSVNDVQTYQFGTKVNVFFDPKDHETVAVVGVAPSGE
jgi:hypothetical protein